MRAGGRRTCPDHDRARIPVGPAERVGPSGGESGGRGLINGIVQVFGTIAGRFDHDDAAVHGIANRGEIIGPPLDRNIAALIGTIGKGVAGTGTMKLDQDDVARAQPRRSRVDRACRSRPAEDRDRADHCVGRDALYAKAVVVPAELAQHGGAMVAPADVGGHGTADDAALIDVQILVGEAPCPLHIDNADRRTAPARLRPCPARLDAAGCRIEVQLTRRKIGTGRRRFVARRGHIVQMDRRLGPGLHIGTIDQIVPDQVGLQRLQRFRRGIDRIEGRQPARIAGRSEFWRVARRDHALFGRAEQRGHRRPMIGKQRSQRVGGRARQRLEPPGRRTHCGFRMSNDHEFGRRSGCAASACRIMVRFPASGCHGTLSLIARERRIAPP